MKLSDLNPWDKNPRLIDDDAAGGLAVSMDRFGDVSGITFNKRNGALVSGHQRINELRQKCEGDPDVAMLEEGLGVIVVGERAWPVRFVDWDDTTHAAANVAANSPFIAGEYTEDVGDILMDLSLDADLFEGLRFDDLADSLDLDAFDDTPEITEDEAPEAPVVPVSKEGDLWILGEHKILCGDSTKEADVERLMDGVKADLWITDPPYNVDYTGKTKDALKVSNDSMSDGAFREFLLGAFQCALSHMKPGASFYIWHADSEGYNFRGAIHDCDEQVRQCLVWKKQTMVMGRQDYQWKHEPCLYGWKKGASHGWYSDRTQTTILEFDRPFRSEDHPTMKPVALFSYQIGNSTAPQGVVLDTFVGSGTTIVACEALGRSCRAIELAPQYVDVAALRWMRLTGKEAHCERKGKNKNWTAETFEAAQAKLNG